MRYTNRRILYFTLLPLKVRKTIHLSWGQEIKEHGHESQKTLPAWFTTLLWVLAFDSCERGRHIQIIFVHGRPITATVHRRQRSSHIGGWLRTTHRPVSTRRSRPRRRQCRQQTWPSSPLPPANFAASVPANRLQRNLWRLIDVIYTAAETGRRWRKYFGWNISLDTGSKNYLN